MRKRIVSGEFSSIFLCIFSALMIFLLSVHYATDEVNAVSGNMPLLGYNKLNSGTASDFSSVNIQDQTYLGNSHVNIAVAYSPIHEVSNGIYMHLFPASYNSQQSNTYAYHTHNNNNNNNNNNNKNNGKDNSNNDTPFTLPFP